MHNYKKAANIILWSYNKKTGIGNITTGEISDRIGRGRQRNYIINNTGDQDQWRVMNTHAV